MFRSADGMLERYLVLWAELAAPRTMGWPDPRAPRIQTSSTPGSGRRERQLAEFADIGRCVHLARLSALERRLFFELYRPRHRICRRCGFTTPAALPRCPRCQAERRDGWTHEPLPTLPVLCAALQKKTKEPWSTERVRRLRDRAYDRLEAVMRRRGLLEEDNPLAAG